MSAAIRAAKASIGGPVRERVQGDPGLFSFLGKTVGGALRRAGRFIPGPVGAVAGAAGGLLAGRAGQVTPVPSPADLARRFQQVPVEPVPGVRGVLERAIPGGRTGLQVTVPVDENGACPSGFHRNKSGYFRAAQPGNPEAGGVWVPKGSVCVKNRRRNPLNPRARDRAISRLVSAKKADEQLRRVTIRPRKCPK